MIQYLSTVLLHLEKYTSVVEPDPDPVFLGHPDPDPVNKQIPDP